MVQPVKTAKELMQRHMPSTLNYLLSRFHPVVIRTHIANKIIPKPIFLAMQREKVALVESTNRQVLAQVWHLLQLERTKIRERDTGPMIGYTSDRVDDSLRVLSTEEQALGEVIAKVEQAITQLGGRFTSGAAR